ncbi:MAG: ABC transporter permease [Lachnospiraceae bacterium]|nr:ABC transporter permease [Lachnospiraceae bacterium]HCJ09220.1 ABC transporter permease [Lachnospiraceae bacterium]
MLKRIKEILSYKDMIKSLVKRELRGRYQKSVLGFLWSFISPLCQIAVFTVVFTYVFPSNIPKYYIYLMVGMIPWQFFTDSLSQGACSIIYNADMTKKIYFPREVLTISSVTAKFVNLLLSMIVVFGFITFSGIGFSYLLFLLPFAFIVEYAISLGFALFFAAITVYLRDIEYVVNVILMAWIWATPVMYAPEGLVQQYPWLESVLRINPLTSVMYLYRDILYYHVLPARIDIIIPIVWGVALLLIGETVFKHLEGNFAEEL